MNLLTVHVAMYAQTQLVASHLSNHGKLGGCSQLGRKRSVRIKMEKK